ncbi:MAG TPA: hypothetical protein VLB44_07935, partial [Kofleriaceae bacterium]|nr:hypothetical protein [Kofleriaceae bacterium]
MRRVMTLVVVACASAACDGVFNLDHVEPQGAAIDAAIDASACPAPAVDDEDGDGLDDSCDPCPFANDNVTDADGDGITGICDPDPAVPNQRVLFSGFGLSTTSQFITSGGTIEGGTFHTAATAGAGTLFRSIGVDHVWVTAGVNALSLGGSVYHEIGIIF